MGGFFCVEGKGAAGLCVTEFARTGTDISAYHKCGCSFSPAFTHIGTTTTAADGVQFVRIYNMFCFGISCICTYAYFQPVRFFNVIHGYLFFQARVTVPDRYLLFQILNKEVAYTGEQVVACIAAKNAMVTVGVNLHVNDVYILIFSDIKASCIVFNIF